ncbi:MAG TPA: CHAT domain-containing tetratricopeptide repeat protein [Vicinamibacterales bacterium]|nr:CHAT domain-containing tetratricopeptide repeat protein [Vicinamibacterales bacterium]
MTMRRLLCLALWLAIATSHAPVRAQEDARFPALVEAARHAQAAKAWDEAARQYQAVVDLARERHDALWEARGVWGLGDVAYGRAHYDEARRLALQALAPMERLESWRDVQHVEILLGNISALSGEEDEARQHYVRGRDLAERLGEARERAFASFNLARLGHGVDEAAMRSLLREIEPFHDAQFEADVLHMWGDHLFSAGDYDGAIEKLEAAAAKYDGAGNRDRLSLVYNSLGRLYRNHGQIAAALEYQLKALAIQDTIDSPRARIQSLNAVAVTYQDLGDRENARRYYQRAIAMAEETGAASILNVLRGNYGTFLVDAGDPATGLPLLEEASRTGPFQSMRFDSLAHAYGTLGRLDAAREAAGRALDTCPAGTPPDCIRARLARATAALALGDTSAALADQTEALDELERLHQTLAASDFLKQGFNDLWAPAYALEIDLQFRQGAIAAALETAERGRARAFLDLMASRDAGSPAGGSLAWRGAGGGSDLPSTAAAAPPGLTDIVPVLAKRRATLLQYWVGGDRLFIWVVAPSGRVNGAAVNQGRGAIERLVHVIGDPAAGASKAAAWASLSRILIEPVIERLPRTPGARVVVVPDGPLLHLPFAALKDRQGRYLVERFTLSSVPSVAMLRLPRPPGADGRAGRLLLVADPSSPPIVPGDARLPRLPGAVEEARAIARLAPARATTLARDTATEARVLDAAPHKAVIHFATHAIVRDRDPLSSFLLLGRAAGGGADGRLTARKIYGLRLDADLVVLSACRTGGGLITGDGIASLARAFFYAGAASVVVSVWDVADESGKRLLPAFYRGWLGGMAKDRALRAAQLAFIDALRAGRVTVPTPAGDVPLVEDPALWAGFVLLGET